MKKFIISLITLLTISLGIIAQVKFVVYFKDGQKTEFLSSRVDSVTFTNKQESTENKKIKYFVEEAFWVTYSSNQYDNINTVNKSVIERDNDARYILSQMYYTNDELQEKYIVTSEGNKDYFQLIYPENQENNFTYIWYDDARTKIKENISSEDYKCICEYDANDRLISSKCYYKGIVESSYAYSYSGLVRYGETTYCSITNNNDGSYISQIASISRDTTLFTDYTYTQEKEIRRTSQNLGGFKDTYVYTALYEIGTYGPVKIESSEVRFNQYGAKLSESNQVQIFTWIDELNNTFISENETNSYNSEYNYKNRVEGYTKYTY